ncbi:MAG: type I methionyl aminopeptidase [Patescibacteria group bacterium]
MVDKIFYKNPAEIKTIETGGKILAEILTELLCLVKVGHTGMMLERRADELIKKNNVQNAFKGYRGFPNHLIVCVNDETVHCFPTEKEFKEGDVVTLDFGIKYKGYFCDMARTIVLGKNETGQKLINSAKNAFWKAFELCQVGENLINIGKKIFEIATHDGYGIVRQTTGHGIGKNLHEDPIIFNFPHESMQRTILKEGMVICIEPILTEKSPEIVESDDGWKITTKDGGIAVHYENMIAITKTGPKILTELDETKI